MFGKLQITATHNSRIMEFYAFLRNDALGQYSSIH